MKLFQKLLLAPAAIGLFAPLAANASEANLRDVSNYSQVDVEVTQDTFKPLSTTNPLLAGGEGLGQDFSNDFDGDSFSATTTASFSSNWAMGFVDGTTEDKTGNVYDWSVDLTTSFDGNDALDVTLEAGEGDNTLTELDLYDSGDPINVTNVSYTRDIGNYLTMYVSNGGAGSALFSTACAYEGQTDTLDDCANLNTGMDFGYGTAVSFAVDAGNGIGVAIGYEGENNTDGLMTDEGVDGYGVQVSYIKDNFGFSYTFVHDENSNAANALTGGETDYQAFNAFYNPSIDRFPSISFGIENSDDNNQTDETKDESSHYFIGAQFENVGNGTLGGAVGSKTPTAEDGETETMWEAYYAYEYADGITITPVVFVKENAETGVDDETGIILKTSFEF